MLGMVFTEFMEMVEARFSPELLDRVIERASPPNGGAYTAVGYYPHQEIVALVVALSEESGIETGALVEAFGQHLFSTFTRRYADVVGARSGTIDLLSNLDGDIHVSARKLYPEAQLPRFHVVERTAESITLAYQSPRGMESLAQGLIAGSIAHFAESLTVDWTPGSFDGQPASIFHVRAAA